VREKERKEERRGEKRGEEIEKCYLFDRFCLPAFGSFCSTEKNFFEKVLAVVSSFHSFSSDQPPQTMTTFLRSISRIPVGFRNFYLEFRQMRFSSTIPSTTTLETSWQEVPRFITLYDGKCPVCV
jgi:hypothetical protein